jgi:hypothetical protein
LKKEKNKLAKDLEEKTKGFKETINNLQTQLENANTALEY